MFLGNILLIEEETQMSEELLKDKNEEFLSIIEYVKHFGIHYDLLINRYKRFVEINKISNTDIDVITYLDIIVVQLRAMCIESANYKNNYTAQILLRKFGRNDLADKIDNMLNEPFIPETVDFSIRRALKTLADRFVCHYDNFDRDSEAWAMATIVETQLKNPYIKPNLDYIIKTMTECVEQGLDFEKYYKNTLKKRDSN